MGQRQLFQTNIEGSCGTGKGFPKEALFTMGADDGGGVLRKPLAQPCEEADARVRNRIARALGLAGDLLLSFCFSPAMAMAATG
jgi:hypothetical protein